MTEARIKTATSFPWAGFAGQIPARSAEDVQRAKEWSARQARKPWPVLSPDSPLARRERHRRVQEWRQSRPVVARIRQVRPSDELAEKAAAWWQITITGTDDGWLFQRHRTAVWMGDMLAREEMWRRGSDTEEPPNA